MARGARRSPARSPPWVRRAQCLYHCGCSNNTSEIYIQGKLVTYNPYSSLPMLRLLLAKPQGHKDSRKSKPCYVDIHWIALTSSTLRLVCIYQGFSHISGFFAHFVLAKLPHCVLIRHIDQESTECE